MKSIAYKITPRFLKNFIKFHFVGGRGRKRIAKLLKDIVCIDIGASYFPHTKWGIFLESENVNWIAVEPNERNLDYTKAWKHEAQLEVCPFGLSYDGGVKTLYVTNVDSGSSLLKPVINRSVEHRVVNRNYFFPIKEVEIDTRTLASIVDAKSSDVPIILKLDTQGTELSIIKSIEERIKMNQVLGFELECTLLATPIMEGSSKFWEVCKYLEEFGYELLDLDVIRSGSILGQARIKGKSSLSECDAVFALRRDLLASKSLDFRIAMFVYYISYGYNEEAVSLIRFDRELSAHISSHGEDEEELCRYLINNQIN